MGKKSTVPHKFQAWHHGAGYGYRRWYHRASHCLPHPGGRPSRTSHGGRGQVQPEHNGRRSRRNLGTVQCQGHSRALTNVRLWRSVIRLWSIHTCLKFDVSMHCRIQEAILCQYLKKKIMQFFGGKMSKIISWCPTFIYGTRVSKILDQPLLWVCVHLQEIGVSCV